MNESIKRREFLGQSSAAALVGAAAVTSVASESAADEQRRQSGRLEDFRAEDFEDLVNDTFLLQPAVDARPAAAKLIDARRHPLRPGDARPAHVRQDVFSLVFATDSELRDDMHAVRHGRFGEFQLSIHQIKLESHANMHVYEAVIG